VCVFTKSKNNGTGFSRQMLSMGIAMMLFALLIGHVEITPEYYPQFVSSMHSTFVLFMVLCIIGIAASLKRGKQQQVREK
jgi:hypothetical protein